MQEMKNVNIRGVFHRFSFVSCVRQINTVQVTILITITEEHEAESTFLKNKNFVFVTFRLPQLN